jgi:type III pantothenate kinase
LIVRSDLKLGIQLAVDQPEQVGTDRLCNAAAAFQEAGGASIVVDAGTATKVEAISADGVLLGGAIAPGIGVSLEALVRRAAQLYDVPLEFPKNPIGVNTVEAVQSGLVIGHLGLIEGLVERFREQIGIDAPVILTGGYGHLFWQKSIVFAKFDPELTLRGLQRIWQLNR